MLYDVGFKPLMGVFLPECISRAVSGKVLMTPVDPAYGGPRDGVGETISFGAGRNAREECIAFSGTYVPPEGASIRHLGLSTMEFPSLVVLGRAGPYHYRTFSSHVTSCIKASWLKNATCQCFAHVH